MNGHKARSCPFCGGDNLRLLRSSDTCLYQVFCRNKECMAAGPVLDKYPRNGDRVINPVAAAIEKWNSRISNKKTKNIARSKTIEEW